MEIREQNGRSIPKKESFFSVVPFDQLGRTICQSGYVKRLNPLADFIGAPEACEHEFVGRMQAQPRLGSVAEHEAERDGDLSVDPALVFDNFVDGRCGNTGAPSELGLVYPVFLDEVQEVATRGGLTDGLFFGSHGVCPFFGSVVIGDFNVVSVSVCPAEADTPLCVDTDGVLPIPVAGEGFEMVAGGKPEMVETRGVVQID